MKLDLSSIKTNEIKKEKSQEEIEKEEKIQQEIYREHISKREYKPIVLVSTMLYFGVLIYCMFYFYYAFDIFLGLIIISYGMIWVYAILSVVANDFKKDSNKIVWIIALIFIPPICIMYPDIKLLQVEEQ